MLVKKITRDLQNTKNLDNCKIITLYNNIPKKFISFASLLKYMRMIIFVNTMYKINKKLGNWHPTV